MCICDAGLLRCNDATNYRSSSTMATAATGGAAAAATGGAGTSSAGAASGASRVEPGQFVAEALSKAGVLDSDTANAYGQLFSRFMRQSRKITLDWSKIAPPSKDMVTEYSDLEPCPDDPALHHELLNKVAVVKLNGGLGTSMGCKGPKSAIHVRSGMTFLDLTVRQVEFLNTKYGVDVPLILMNSFRTHETTVKVLNKYQTHNLTITCFTQSCFPRIDRDHYTPLPIAPFSSDTSECWYPPGHGDVYRALDKSGLLDTLMEQGKEVVFISNVDNLGATLDLNVIYHLIKKDVEFCMEVTDKTRADLQGGTLIQYEGKAKLIELTQVPREHEQDFKSLKTYTCFNTNNLWVSLKSMKALLAAHAVQPTVVVSERTVHGSPVLELETAAGAAIEFFPKAKGVRVPRSRFLPVKNTSDLLAIQSNLYDIRHGTLIQNPLRDLATPPVIKLGPEFTDLDAYSERIPYIPDIVFLDHLTVSGNVHFGKDMALRGTVIIVASEGGRIDLPAGTELENKVVTGSLRVYEH